MALTLSIAASRKALTLWTLGHSEPEMEGLSAILCHVKLFSSGGGEGGGASLFEPMLLLEHIWYNVYWQSLSAILHLFPVLQIAAWLNVSCWIVLISLSSYVMIRVRNKTYPPGPKLAMTTSANPQRGVPTVSGRTSKGHFKS